MDSILEICRAISGAGGRALVAGGYVRDKEMKREAKDVDVEVFGLDVEQLESVLGEFGEVMTIGRAFGVLRIKGIDVDWSLPRRDSKVGAGHKGFEIECDPSLSYEEASRRRDLTINSMALDPLTGEVLDPHGGRADIAARALRATDPEHFGDDPLRAVRVAQLIARLEFDPDDQLVDLCRQQDLSELSAERLFEELRKLLLRGTRPSLGFEFLRKTNLLRFFPELEAMVDVPQDPEWHPEGDVWVHTMMVIDEAARLRQGDEDDLALMLGALCHDLGKPATTVRAAGRVRSPQHDVKGIEPTEAFLQSLRAPNDLTAKVNKLVEHHLAPAMYEKGNATPKAYRRLARKLEKSGVTMELLHRVAMADHFGRTTPDAIAREFPAGDLFLARAQEYEVELQAPKDVVLGRHLMARGMAPGPEFGTVLARCREIQDETGWTDPEQILDVALRASQE